ncbi:MAG: Dolichyl-phosphate-mannose-protein mannosyltransferase [Geminicoccaceae bacterium]|jgi:hypothetical protein|nr:Dolichyl-phosphate-mannose-protein mannosyltransferase [Geminicoccaceae bacterium]
MNNRRFQSIVCLLTVWAIAAAVFVSRIDRGWVPHDEGTIAHTAERVLAGELPHRDFEDPYTGGLAYVNAGAMRMFGVNLRSPRVLLVAAFLLCIPAFYYSATRFASPVAAGATTLLAAFWSLPNYVAAMPSWYNLIFAVFGVAALLRFVDTSQRRWLFVAGVCGGLSFLMKLIGLFYIAGVLLFLVLREQESDEPATANAADGVSTASGDSVYRVVVLAGLLVFALALGLLVTRTPGIDFPLNFLVPAAALVAALAWNEQRVSRGQHSSASRFRALARVVLPFGVGVVIPVAVFLVPYVLSGAVGHLVQGVFMAPTARLEHVALAPLPWRNATPVLAIIGLLVVARRADKRASMLLALAVAIVGVYAVWSAATKPDAYRTLLYAVVPLPVLTVAAAAAIVGRTGNRSSLRRQRLMIVGGGLAMFSLVQFPYAAPIYFCFVTPLLALAALAVISELELPSLAIPAALAATFIAFAATRVNPGFLYAMGSFYMPYTPLTPLTMPRAGGLRVPPRSSQEYGYLVEAVRRHDTRTDAYIYVAPVAPEVYFLSGLRNPTNTLNGFSGDDARTDRVLGVLRTKDVRVIALNSRPEYTSPVSGDLRAALEREYPRAEGVGRFEVRWRE